MERIKSSFEKDGEESKIGNDNVNMNENVNNDNINNRKEIIYIQIV